MLKSLHDRPLTLDLALVLVVSRDPIKLRASQVNAEVIPNRTFQTLEELGHWSHVKAPQRVLTAIAAWLRQQPTSPRSYVSDGGRANPNP